MSSRILGRFNPDELTVLAELVTTSRWPFPLQVRSSSRTEDDLGRARRTALGRLTAGGVVRDNRVEPDLEAALRTLVRPLVRLDVTGTSGPEPADAVRIAAAHSGGPAVLAHQLPGPGEHTGGDVLLMVLPRTEVGGAVATELWAALPPTPPGRTGPVSVTRADVSGDETASFTMSASKGRTELARDQLRMLSRGPFATAGQIGVTRVRPDGAHDRRCTLRWFDIGGDGRYLTDSARGIDVTPADETTLTRALAVQLPG